MPFSLFSFKNSLFIAFEVLGTCIGSKLLGSLYLVRLIGYSLTSSAWLVKDYLEFVAVSANDGLRVFD
jgi:hypothetical protein